MALRIVLILGECSHQRRHLFQLPRPSRQVDFQPLDHVEAGLQGADELGLGHRRQFLFKLVAVHGVVVP